ncbi:MAG: ROK family protein [Chloroflexota bacterium]
MQNQPLTVTLSVGQSKIGAGAIDTQGNIVCLLDEIATPPDWPSRYAASAQQILAVIREVGIDHVIRAGVSFPEMMPPPSRLIANPETLPNTHNPYHEGIETLVHEALSQPLSVELLHDAAAAVLGEVSVKGSLPNCQDCVSIVWGTGVASGVVSDGQLYWNDAEIALMTGEIGLQVMRQADGSFVYRPAADVPALNDGEYRLDRWLRGPALAERFVGQVREDERGSALLAKAAKTIDDLDLIDVNRAARQGDAFAVELIASAGNEMGRALARFVYYWLVERKMTFARTIVIGSGVAKLGDGVTQAGSPVLITAIRQALGDALYGLGVDDYDVSKVCLSTIGYEREFYAFL